MCPASDITQLLERFSDGDEDAMNALLPLVYGELKALADRALRNEHRRRCLDATELVHEAYLRLIDQHRVNWQHRAQFFGVAAQMMRRILVDHARRINAAKRRGDRDGVPFEEHLLVVEDRNLDLAAIDDALNKLAKIDEKQTRIVELRFFGGLTIEEAAEVMGISPATLKREWAMAKAWLFREISA